jgi:hypothetical protein
MIKKFKQYLKENLDDIKADDEYTEMSDEIKSYIENTIETSGGEYSSFIENFIKTPEDVKIEGLINDSDVYDFYLKYRNDIDEILNNINYFDEVPSESNIFSLYSYTIEGTIRSVIEIVKRMI